MFGLNEALMSFIRRQVGLRTDAADANGSLHGKIEDVKNKIAELRNYIDTTLPKPRKAVCCGSFSTSQQTYQTALSVTGRGKLNALQMQAGDTHGALRIIVDGNLVAASRVPVNVMSYPSPAFLLTANDTFFGFAAPKEGGSAGNLGGGITFSKSLLIQIRSLGISTTTCSWAYEKE